MFVKTKKQSKNFSGPIKKISLTIIFFIKKKVFWNIKSQFQFHSQLESIYTFFSRKSKNSDVRCFFFRKKKVRYFRFFRRGRR